MLPTSESPVEPRYYQGANSPCCNSESFRVAVKRSLRCTNPRITSQAKVLPGRTLIVLQWSESFRVAVKRNSRCCQSANRQTSHQLTNREYSDRAAIANHSELQLSEAYDIADPRFTSRAKVLPGRTLAVLR